MKERAQQMMWVHERGLVTLLPPHVTKKVANLNGNPYPSQHESERLRVISQDSILKKRFPTPEDGSIFMEKVNYERRERLLNLARDLTGEAVKSWQTIKPRSPIAVLIFGSVAKGMVKDPQRSMDPSNIDLAVIVNDYSDEDKKNFMDAIRNKRKDVQKAILSDFPVISSEEKNPGNAGVHLTTEKKVRNSNFGLARTLIGSSAFPLHDPNGIWGNIEADALQYSLSRQNKGKRT